MREEAITLEELFTEELEAIVDMLEALVEIRDDYDTMDPNYYSVQNEIVKLEQTALYLADRLSDRVPCSWLKDK